MTVDPPTDPAIQAAPAAGPGPVGTGSPPGGRGKRRLVAAVIVVALVVVAAGAAFAVIAARNRFAPTSSTTPPTATTVAPTTAPTTGSSPSSGAEPSTTDVSSPPTGAAAADQIATAVNQSRAVRPQVAAAISQVASCTLAPRPAELVLDSATATRSRAIARLRAIDPSGIANGTPITRTLIQALDASSTADRAYRAWMVDFDNSGRPCNRDPTTNPAYQAGDAASAQAQAAKQAFVTQWDPVAPTYGLPTYQAGDF